MCLVITSAASFKIPNHNTSSTHFTSNNFTPPNLHFIRAALKRVREEIARDRAEKAQRYKKEKSEQDEKKQQVLDEKAQAAAEAAQIDYAEKCKNTKLQVKAFDGICCGPIILLF